MLGAFKSAKRSFYVIPTRLGVKGLSYHTRDELGPLPLTGTLVDLGDEIFIQEYVQPHSINISHGKAHGKARDTASHQSTRS
ncbi:MAG: hypothetical protein ACC683_01605 [Acidimicrobiia bacterium]